jgi:ATP-dependent DNA helicase RecG
MMENQNIEWKEYWQDEYLKSLCGFANAQGGLLEIGRNNKGEVVGIFDAKKLLEELPNKIRTTMGIIANVNLQTENGHEYITIEVSAYPNAISYKGKYYFSSGSTTQELTGYALDELILSKQGRTWDAFPVPHVSPSDFYHDAFEVFLNKSVNSKRLSLEDVAVSDATLLEALKLTEGKYL